MWESELLYFLLYATLCPFLYCNYLDGKERAGCFASFVFPRVSWWLSGSSSRGHEVVCGLWLWYMYFLIILSYYFRISKVLLYIVLNWKHLNRCKKTIQELYTSTKPYMYKSYCYAAWCIYVLPFGTWNALCYFDQVIFWPSICLFLMILFLPKKYDKRDDFDFEIIL